MSPEEKVILVDVHDREIGAAEKLSAHQQGQCHRAFSVFIFYKDGANLKLLLQQRQHNKYHSGGLWTNTCCSHPRPGEATRAGAERRLEEEMGIRATLTHAGEFHYRAQFENGLIENEYDHVFVGVVDSLTVTINSNEAADARWVTLSDLQGELKNNPEKFSAWFEQALEVALKKLPLVSTAC